MAIVLELRLILEMAKIDLLIYTKRLNPKDLNLTTQIDGDTLVWQGAISRTIELKNPFLQIVNRSPINSTLRIQDRLGIMTHCNTVYSLDLECMQNG